MTALTSLLDTLAPESREVASEAIKEQQRILIDRLVRAARTEGWCGEFERSMAVIFPDGHPDTGATDPGAWLDSDGFTCRGFDRDGYNMQGLHRDTGRDRAGYDRDGYDHNGRNRDGYDRRGWDVDGYDRDGRNADGLDRDGRDPNGFTVEDPGHLDWVYRFDANGYDADGFDRRGRHMTTGLSRADHANRFRFDGSGRARPVN